MPQRCSYARSIAASSLLLLVRLRKMLLPGDPVPSNSDTEHLINYASLVTRSPEAAAVHQTLRSHGCRSAAVFIVLSTVLKIDPHNGLYLPTALISRVDKCGGQEDYARTMGGAPSSQLDY